MKFEDNKQHTLNFTLVPLGFSSCKVFLQILQKGMEFEDKINNNRW